MKQTITQYKKHGIPVLDNLDISTLSSILSAANTAYYNSDNKPLMTDNEYDIIREFVENKYPSAKILSEIGALPTIPGKQKVKLPYEMPSMNKIKPDTNALQTWKTEYKGPYVLSCKLDGVSGLFMNGKLYTRGNGTIGQDISHFIPHLTPFPNGEYAIRGEFIMKKSTFETKYKSEFANCRNLVSGIINSKSVDQKIADLQFIAYEIVHPPMKPSEQMAALSRLGYTVVQHLIAPNIENTTLSNTLLDWRAHYEYDIDGVIVANDAVYDRKPGNPVHAFAFKMVISDQMAEAKVVDVIWTASKNGYLKPRVRFEPIRLGGVTIEYATGFNGKFIQDHRIGIGATIVIIRSGDVIPYIQSVNVPAETAKMPDIPYQWTNTQVDILVMDATKDDTVLQKNIAGFFTTLEVDGLSIGNVKRMYMAGYDSVKKILAMSIADFEKIDGFKTKMAEKIHTSIHTRIQTATILDLLTASNKMGRGLGSRKMSVILDKYPDILVSDFTADQKIEQLKRIPGIGHENATEFVGHIDSFIDFIKDCGLENKMYMAPPAALSTPLFGNPLFQKSIVMTKTRDPRVIEIIKQSGATLSENMKSDTFLLIVKSKTDTSKKIDEANKKQIPILSVDEFINKYGK